MTTSPRSIRSEAYRPNRSGLTLYAFMKISLVRPELNSEIFVFTKSPPNRTRL